MSELSATNCGCGCENGGMRIKLWRELLYLDHSPASVLWRMWQWMEQR